MESEKLEILESIFGRYYVSGEELLFKCPKCGHHKNKFSIKNSLKILFLYSMLIKRILGIYNFKNIFLFKNYFHNRCIDCDIVLVYPDNDKWILKGISEDLKSNLKNQSLNVKSIPAKQLFRYYQR